MRVMVIVKASKDSEAGKMPSKELLQAMGAYNEELAKAGIMKDGMGLKASSQGARVSFGGDGERKVRKGPFTESNDLIAGFWIWEVESLDQAIDWASRCPDPHEEAGELEIRPVFEEADFADLA